MFSCRFFGCEENNKKIKLFFRAKTDLVATLNLKNSRRCLISNFLDINTDLKAPCLPLSPKIKKIEIG
jgi:hypothetical protein